MLFPGGGVVTLLLLLLLRTGDGSKTVNGTLHAAIGTFLEGLRMVVRVTSHHHGRHQLALLLHVYPRLLLRWPLGLLPTAPLLALRPRDGRVVRQLRKLLLHLAGANLELEANGEHLRSDLVQNLLRAGQAPVVQVVPRIALANGTRGLVEVLRFYEALLLLALQPGVPDLPFHAGLHSCLHTFFCLLPVKERKHDLSFLLLLFVCLFLR
jgi:hypothetical protein